MTLDLKLQVCPGTLAPGFSTYSPRCLREMFNGKKVRHVLSFPSPRQEGEQQRDFYESRAHISISGVQEKYSLKLEGKELMLVDKSGEYILKPIPGDLMSPSQVPANEHLTMQLAQQVYKLNVAKNAIIFFNDGQPAYITRRFDVKPDHSRCMKEDFAVMAEATTDNKGKNYKYDYSYLQMSGLIDRYFPAAIPAKEQFFQLLLFNYLFSNGDAHLKNFSRIDCEGKGDGVLAPAYDLVNTRLHVNDSDLALKGGLYEEDYKYSSYAHFGYYAFDDFYEFGLKIGLKPIRIKRFMLQFLNNTEDVVALTNRSFLNPPSKEKYLGMYTDKHRRLSMSYSGLLNDVKI